jgi:hypothetical protein
LTIWSGGDEARGGAALRRCLIAPVFEMKLMKLPVDDGRQRRVMSLPDLVGVTE